MSQVPIYLIIKGGSATFFNYFLKLGNYIY